MDVVVVAIVSAGVVQCKGHFGSRAFVLYWEAVLWWEVQITIFSDATVSVLYTEVVLWWEGPL